MTREISNEGDLDTREISIEGDLVTRVEGHGSIVLNAVDGTIEQLEWQIPEAPRFFESMLLGRSWDEAHHITARICAICSISHTLASLKATERAMDIEITERDRKLRKLGLYAETLQSHVLHLGYLALPDLVDQPSVLPMVETHEAEVETVIRLHRLGNDLTEAVAGRSVHAQRMVPGGFTKLPDESELEELRDRLDDSWDDVTAVVELIQSLADELPAFTRETEYISLTHPEEYALYGGDVYSSDVGRLAVEQYRDIANEYVVERSTAKWTKHERESYAVGALARFNNNADQLNRKAQDVADAFGLEPVCYNPFMNNVAQLVEVAHLLEESIQLIDELLDGGLESQSDYHSPDVTESAGNGIGALEVPRGVLFHEYTYDGSGTVTDANCVIPTNQNHGNIQHDFEALVPSILDRPEAEIEHELEMLVRAYDPCISCSTHYLDVEFVHDEG